MIGFNSVTGFQWDEGNARKPGQHGVTQEEAEQIFGNEPLSVVPDHRHSASEPRWHALGRTDGGRRLHLTFTLRAEGTQVHIISARDMHRKERLRYAQET